MTAEADAVRKDVVQPALKALEPVVPWTLTAENQVLNTMAHESGGFRFRRQVGGGPGRGLPQFEEPSFRDIYDRALGLHPVLKGKVDALWPNDGSDPWLQIETNDIFAAAMCRLRYWFSPAKLTFDPRDVFESARCWGQFYNTRNDPKLNDAFIADVRRYVEDVPDQQAGT